MQKPNYYLLVSLKSFPKSYLNFIKSRMH